MAENDVERDLVEGLTGYVEQLKAENRMNEPRVEQWMREAAEKCQQFSDPDCRDDVVRSARIGGLAGIIAAAYAPHDVERLLREWGGVSALSPPSETQDCWRFCPYGFLIGEGRTITDAIAAAEASRRMSG